MDSAQKLATIKSKKFSEKSSKNQSSVKQPLPLSMEDLLQNGVTLDKDWPPAVRAEKRETIKAGTEPKTGDQFKIAPHPATFGVDREPVTYHVINEKGDQVQLSRKDDKDGYGPWMPKASVKHFVNDIEGKVDVPQSDDPLINAVATGKAKLLGKGDDGMAFQVGDQIVKVSTTVPYQPENPGHRTPEGAADMLRRQVELGNHLADLGVKGIQRSRFVKHGDKGFQIREMLDIPKKFSREQLDKIQDTLIGMHKHGFSLNDAVQPGLDKNGEPVFYDVGKAEPITGSERTKEETIDADMDRLSLLYRDGDEVFVRRDKDEATQEWQRVTGSLRRWKEKGAIDFAKKNIEMAAKKRLQIAEATLKGDELDAAKERIDWDVMIAHGDLEPKMNKSLLQKFYDFTGPILERDTETYERVKRVLQKRGVAREVDFEEGGQLYGWSTNELLNLILEDDRSA